ncbi:MAG: FmdB family zinc ribbon protein [Anaerolineae bacterium]
MPIYEYECNEQGHRFEKWQSIQEEPLKVCPVCNGPVHKRYQATGIIFKGSGWYITDSRKSSSSAVTGGTNSGEKSETKSEKSETKSEKSTGASASSEASGTQAKPSKASESSGEKKD